MGNDVNEAGEPVELFGTLELVLSEANSTKYKDVFFLKNRGKKPTRPRSGGRRRTDEGPRQPGHVLQSA